MKFFSYIFIGLLFTLSSFGIAFATFATGSQMQCTTEDFVQGNDIYNDLVCDAKDSISRGDYSQAHQQLLEASRIQLFEEPNFRLYPLLALVDFRLGNKKNAIRNLKKAELSLMVYAELAQCTSYDEDRGLKGLDIDRFEPTLRKEIADEMCWFAFSTYSRATLKAIEWEYLHLQEIRKVERIIFERVDP